MIIEVILTIVGAAGILSFFLVLMQILKYFAAPMRATLIVAILGAVSLGIVDVLIIALFELTKPMDLQFMTGAVLGAWAGIHLAILGLVRQGSREIAVAMIDYSGGCVWIFGSVVGGALGALVGTIFTTYSGWLAPFIAVGVGLIVGWLFGVPFLTVWIHLFRAPGRVVSWAKRLG